MKKRVIIVLGIFSILLMSFLISVSFISLVSASSIGISPAIHEVYYEPGYNRTFVFDVFTSIKDKNVSVYATGDLANYTTFSRNTFSGSGNFKVHLQLPDYIKKPGIHPIFITATPKIDDNAGMIGGLPVIRAPINVFVPYPGKYIEAKFGVKDTNLGNTTEYRLDIHNLGTEDVVVNPVIEIYENNTNNLIKKEYLNSEAINTKKRIIIKDEIDSTEFSPGAYRVEVTLDYGAEDLIIKRDFMVGYLYMNITDYSYRFISGKINHFFITVENLWNQPIENVEAEITITANGSILDTIRTIPETINPWKKQNLTGFLDASEIPVGRYFANMRVLYEGEVSSKLVAVYIKNPPKPDNTWLIILSVSISTFIIIVFFIIMYLIFDIQYIKSNKNIRKEKKRNKK